MLEAESRFTKPREDCPHPDRWHSHDINATEDEVSEFIGGLVRCLQPDLVLETGTYKGHTALQIGRALHTNGHGKLITLEQNPGLAGDARANLAKYVEFVDVLLCNSLVFALPEDARIDLALFDSGGGDTRTREFRYFSRWMHKHTIVLFHDTARQHENILASVLDLADEDLILPVFLPTPRGLAICQVVK